MQILKLRMDNNFDAQIYTLYLQNLQMKPNSFIYSIWQKPPLDIYLKVYVFNLTNPVEFLSGKEKLKVEEIGPYIYQ